jgi:hypothetical protein
MDIGINKLDTDGRDLELVLGKTQVRVSGHELKEIIQRAAKYKPALRCDIKFKERHPEEFENFWSPIVFSFSDNEVQALLRESQSETLIDVLRYFRDVYTEGLEEKILGNMASMAAKMLREDIDVREPPSLKKATIAIEEMTESLRKLDRQGSICWKPNILQVEGTKDYKLIFGQATVLLTETEVNALMEEAIKFFPG